MNINTLYKPGKCVVSFEVFPPKQDAPLQSLYPTLEQLYALKPDFISVTYGAGGSTQSRTQEIAAEITQSGNTALAHLTCVGAKAEAIDSLLDELTSNGVSNILALRGDGPSPQPLRGGQSPQSLRGQADASGNSSVPAVQKEEYAANNSGLASPFLYAKDLVKHIKARSNLCVGAAAYPEGHPQSGVLESDMRYLKQKVDAGVDFLITQLFFDNNDFFAFRDRAVKAGIRTPISVGVMPVSDASQILRMVRLCGCSIPSGLGKLIALYGNSPDFYKAGQDYCVNQINGLIEAKVDGIHLYTMNKWDIVRGIIEHSSLKDALPAAGNNE